MNDTYDVVVCGTGLKECIISGLLSSVAGKKVLHVDRNSYYGGESASLNLTTLYQEFAPDRSPPEDLGHNREWNVDLIPKFVMACGKLVRILQKTNVSRYLEWKSIEGTYVYQRAQETMWSYIMSNKTIHKVPTTPKEVLQSNLMGLMEKHRCSRLLEFVSRWDPEDVSTHQGFDMQGSTMRDVYTKFDLCDNTIDFLGHAVALYTNDDYLLQPCGPTLAKMKLYTISLATYGKSPFIYPIYGLGGLPEGFSRLSAIYGGTYMLNTDIVDFTFDGDGRVSGVKNEKGDVAKCSLVVCDPSYVVQQNRVKKIGQVIRALCILSHQIAQTDCSSCQIILPQKQLNRHNDVYITLLSWQNRVTKNNRYLAIVSTTVETAKPEEEIAAALDLLGDIQEKFVKVSDLYEPTDDGRTSNIFITKSYDATSHFETATEDVLRIWEAITGSPLDLTDIPADEDE